MPAHDTSPPSGRSTRAISGPLRGANTTSTRSTTPSRTGRRAQLSATTAAARGAPGRRGGRRSARSPGRGPPHRAAGPARRRGGARAPAEVEQALREAAVPEHGVRQRLGEPRVVPGVEERDPVGDHLRGVPGRRPVPRRQQRHVAVPCPVEGVPRRAAGPRRPARANSPAQTGQASRASAAAGVRSRAAAERRGRRRPAARRPPPPR